MAVWQATFEVLVPAGGLPSDYEDRLGRLLPRGRHWDRDSKRFGLEDGDTVTVSFPERVEVFARFDLRQWRPALYEGFLDFVQSIGGRLRDAERNIDVPPTVDAFMGLLRGSRAARFVSDPAAYFEELKTNPIRVDEEP